MTTTNRKRRRQTATHSLHVGMMLHQAASRWQRVANEALSEIGVNHTQFMMLWGIQNLQQDEITPTQVELSSYTRTDVMLTSKTLRSLEELGFVTRERHPSDTRARVISLTELGTTACQRAEELLTAVEIQFFQETADPSLRSSLLAILSS